MVVNKRSKNERCRGSHTHGGGSKKKRRGAGNRGGRGMAGSGKRAKTKKFSILKEFGLKYFGKHGLKRPQKLIKTVNAVNLSYLDSKLDFYVEKKLVIKKTDVYEVDLEKLGFQKVLGKGDLTHKIKLKTTSASKLAIEKIKNAGGEVIGNVPDK
jgi:large subunit ribosomal protein L15